MAKANPFTAEFYRYYEEAYRLAAMYADEGRYGEDSDFSLPVGNEPIQEMILEMIREEMVLARNICLCGHTALDHAGQGGTRECLEPDCDCSFHSLANPKKWEQLHNQRPDELEEADYEYDSGFQPIRRRDRPPKVNKFRRHNAS